jgi:hypothetical protein
MQEKCFKVMVNSILFCFKVGVKQDALAVEFNITQQAVSDLEKRAQLSDDILKISCIFIVRKPPAITDTVRLKIITPVAHPVRTAGGSYFLYSYLL